jgi:hypothetical protein
MTDQPYPISLRRALKQMPLVDPDDDTAVEAAAAVAFGQIDDQAREFLARRGYERLVEEWLDSEVAAGRAEKLGDGSYIRFTSDAPEDGS